MIHKIKNKQQNSKSCFVCGLKNSFGIKAAFYETENKELIALFTPTDKHQSYPGRLHGGVASAILDETIGRAIMIGKEGEVWGVTLELKTKFRKPIPLNVELKVIGRIISETYRLFEGTGELVLPNGDVAVTAEGKYLKTSIDKIADFDRDENEWRITSMTSDPEVIEIIADK